MNGKQLKETAMGGIVSNPIFVLVLGMCPTIAMSTNLSDAFTMGVATTFVLVCSNVLISLLRKIIPDKVRLPVYIVLIATFCTLVELFMNKFLPDLYAKTQTFIALIVVNCIILGRAEAFANKNDVLNSLIDGCSMGIGFILAMCLLGGIRQVLVDYCKIAVFGMAPGGFLVLGLLMALFNFVFYAVKKRAERKRPMTAIREA